MKYRLTYTFLSVVLAISLFVTAAYASNAYQTTDTPIGSSNEVLMVGTIMPSIMSVTMPTYVPFHVSRTMEGDNKVISPRITMINNSSIPVALDVVYTAVDLSNLEGTTWATGADVGENQIAIGFQLETLADQMPTALSRTMWLKANVQETISVMTLDPYASNTMYVVGALGNAVPENCTFSVTPTFVVREA